MQENKSPTESKLNLKFQMDTKTKRIRDVPQSFLALKMTVEALAGEDALYEDGLAYSIQYVDKDDELINVSDDEDLKTAYQVAELDLEGNLKFVVSQKNAAPVEKRSVKKVKKEKKDKKDKKTKKGKKGSEEEKRGPFFPLGMPPFGHHHPPGHPPFGHPPFGNPWIRHEIKEVFENQMNNQAEEEEDIESASEEEVAKPRGCPMMRGQMGKMPPRRAIKKLIHRELEVQAPMIFNQLMKCRELGQEYSSLQENREGEIVQHLNVACDGCGIAPITGIRYKCSVCKNFDYCEVCEERREHEHPFIKLVKANDCPSAIFTGVNEEEPQHQPHHGHHGPHHWGGHHGHGRGWGRGGCGEFGRFFRNEFGPPRDWMKNPEFKNLASNFLGMAENFVEKASAENEEEKKEGETQLTKEQKEMMQKMLFMAKNYMAAKEQEPEKNDDWGFGKCRQKWAEKRAVILRVPEEVLVGEPGQTVFAEVEVQNQTKWPWKRGISIGLVDKKEGSCPLAVRDFPVDQEVVGMQSLTVQVPIEIPSDFQNSKESPVLEVPLAFYGPRGNSFGQQFVVKVQVKEGETELALFQMAMTLAEAGMGTLDECVEVCRKCNMDEGAALQMLLEKQNSTQ